MYGPWPRLNFRSLPQRLLGNVYTAVFGADHTLCIQGYFDTKFFVCHLAERLQSLQQLHPSHHVAARLEQPFSSDRNIRLAHLRLVKPMGNARLSTFLSLSIAQDSPSFTAFFFVFLSCRCCVTLFLTSTVVRFSSNLPGGSAAGRRGGSKGGGYCILDCVFHELDQTFFVLDMMAWKVSRRGCLVMRIFVSKRS